MKRRKIASGESSYYSQAYPGNYGKDFTKGYKAPEVKTKECDKKFKHNEISKAYTDKKQTLDQNAQDASTQYKSVSKSWKDQDKGFVNTVKATELILNQRFAKFDKALDIAGESFYKGLDSSPLRQALFLNFKKAGYDTDTANYIIENAFDESSEQFHTALVNTTKKIYALDDIAFSKKIASISREDKNINPSLEE